MLNGCKRDLGIVLQVVFYAMFPVIFPLFLMPQTGVGALKGYLTGFFYLASWGPLYVILHMFVMSRAASLYHAASPTGPTLLVSDGMASVNESISTLAGGLSVPVTAKKQTRPPQARPPLFADPPAEVTTTPIFPAEVATPAARLLTSAAHK